MTDSEKQLRRMNTAMEELARCQMVLAMVANQTGPQQNNVSLTSAAMSLRKVAHKLETIASSTATTFDEELALRMGWQRCKRAGWQDLGKVLAFMDPPPSTRTMEAPYVSARTTEGE